MEFIDLAAQRRHLGDAIDKAIAGVLDHGRFIMGPEVTELEQALAEYSGAQHVVTCANGTDALVLALRALGVAAGDAVLVPTFTFAATAEAVVLAGATPVFVDIRPDTYNLDADRLDEAKATVEERSLRLVGVVTVDLFGQPADYDVIEPWCRANAVWLLDDAAQSFGASLDARRMGTFGDVTTTSFFPAKPLGCYGDGGAVLTDDAELAAVLRSLRVHGSGGDKYDNVRVGWNSRLDTMQAAILLTKLVVLADEIDARQTVAKRYSDALAGVVEVPAVRAGAVSAWAQYTIRVRDRDDVAARLRAAEVPTAVYYPRPLHRLAAYHSYPTVGSLAVSEEASSSVLSLPMHPYLDDRDQARVVDAVIAAAGETA